MQGNAYHARELSRSKWLEMRERELRADDPGIEIPIEQWGLWRNEWSAEIHRACDRHERVELPAARSFVRACGVPDGQGMGDAARHLRFAANYEELLDWFNARRVARGEG